MTVATELQRWSAEGVQEDTLQSLRERLPRGGAVLELGAGNGRLSRMLKDAGYDVVAGDWNAESFGPEDIVCRKVDCDDPMWLQREFGGKKYDAVVCGDLIEHLENPFQFLRVVGGLVRASNDMGGGWLFVTTPNVVSPASRVNLLVLGNPSSFGVGGETMGHINPLFINTMRVAFKCAGFACVETRGVGHVARCALGERSVRGIAQKTLACLLRPLMFGACPNPVMLFVGRHMTGAETSGSVPAGVGNVGCYVSGAAER